MAMMVAGISAGAAPQRSDTAGVVRTPPAPADESAPVSIRMARDQQLPLNPEKLSGPCGRLLCCLQFEHGMYLDLLRDLPRKNARVCHEGSGACGKVTKLHPLAGTVDVQTDQGLLTGVPAQALTRVTDPAGGKGRRPEGDGAEA